MSSLIQGSLSTILKNNTYNEIINYFSHHTLALLMSSIILGFATRKLIRFFRIDTKLNLFSYSNPLYKTIYSDASLGREKVFMIDILTKIENENCLYRGLMNDVVFTKEGSIDYIEILSPKRCFIDKEGKRKPFYGISSGKLIIIGHTILNLNISFDEEIVYEIVLELEEE